MLVVVYASESARFARRTQLQLPRNSFKNNHSSNKQIKNKSLLFSATRHNKHWWLAKRIKCDIRPYLLTGKYNNLVFFDMKSFDCVCLFSQSLYGDFQTYVKNSQVLSIIFYLLLSLIFRLLIIYSIVVACRRFDRSEFEMFDWTSEFFLKILFLFWKFNIKI